MVRSFYRSVGLAVMAASAVLSPNAGLAATVTTLHAFQGGSDGGAPAGNLSIGPDGSLYGKAIENSSNTVVFRIDPVSGANNPVYSGNPGALDDANSGVAFGTSGALYGASYFNAGSGQCGAGCGLIFQVNGTTGSLKTLYQFQNNGDGRGTQGVIAGPGGVLYGLTDEGGASQQGSIFRLDPATGKMVSLHSFNASLEGSDGGAGVGIQFGPDGALYGVNAYAGQNGYGTIYRFDPHSRAFKVLHQFTPAEGNTYIFNTPPSLVIEDNGGTIYGTTLTGGQYGKGMLFRLVVETNELTVLHSFNGVDGSSPTRLVQAPGTAGDLYGLTFYGGKGNFGTVFKFTTAKKQFSSLYSFSNTSDGAYPGQGGLAFAADGSLYGTTSSGGGASGSGSGTVFRLAP